MAKKETLVKGSPEWRAAKLEAKAKLDERLGTARVVVKSRDAIR